MTCIPTHSVNRINRRRENWFAAISIPQALDEIDRRDNYGISGIKIKQFDMRLNCP